MTESEIMADFDDQKYIEPYCRKRKCNYCAGSDFSGEANGDGCEGLERRIKTMYDSILKRRLKRL